MAHFNRRKRFDVQIRVESAQSPQQIEIPLLFQGRMQTTDHVHFGNSERQRFRYRLNNFADGMLEGMSIPFFGGKRAKLTR